MRWSANWPCIETNCSTCLKICRKREPTGTPWTSVPRTIDGRAQTPQARAHPRHPIRSLFAGGGDVFCLQALVAFADGEFDTLAIMQHPVTLSPDGAEVDEYIVPAVARDEAKALAGVKPFHTAT